MGEKEVMAFAKMADDFYADKIIKSKKEVFENIDKELNHTLKAFGKLMQKYKIHSGVQTKLLVPFMRFNLLIRRNLQLIKKR